MAGKVFKVIGVAGLLALSGACSSVAVSAAPGGSPAAPAAAPRWHVAYTAKPGSALAYTAVVATGKTTGWAFGYRHGSGRDTSVALRETGAGTWTPVSFPVPGNMLVVEAGAASPTDVWAFANASYANSSRVLRLVNGKWTTVKTFTAQFYGATVVAGNDVWASTGPHQGGLPLTLWHYDGRRWTAVGHGLAGSVSALSAQDAWAFQGTAVYHWNGHGWAGTSVKNLLPTKIGQVDAILALSARNVYAVVNGYTNGSGPVAVLHYDGHAWRRVATSQAQYSSWQLVAPDGTGGLWIPVFGGAGGAGHYMLHYAAGKLTVAGLPFPAGAGNIGAITRIPGTRYTLAGGERYTPGKPGTGQVAVILQYS
jgi:hypothetical protein